MKPTPSIIRTLVSGIGAGLILTASALAQNDGTKARTEQLQLPVDHDPIMRVTVPTATSFAPVLKKATPAVVAVYTAEIVRVVQAYGSPEEQLLRRLFGLPSPRRQAPTEDDVQEHKIPQGTGSGVIVSPDGYILTNNHVVMDQRGDDADEILVKLNDGRELPATIVGRDAKTDIAVLKVEAEALPAIKIADSDQLEVGDVVFAIGNPMGVGITVTQGIVSAQNRAIGIYGRDGYENFIQTDAAINVGNSGGALVDTSGRLIGLNSAILSRSGGSIGIGFAIPSNLAVSVTHQLTTFGKVKRGFLGVNISDVTPDLAKAFGLESAQGVLIDDIQEGLAADRSGLERGDVVLRINGRPVHNSNGLRARIAQIPPGTKIGFEIIRNGKSRTIEVEVGDQEQQFGGPGNELFEGVTVAPLDAELRRKFAVPSRARGLAVTEVSPDSLYARYLRAGTVILEVNDQGIATIEEARAALRRGVNKFYVYDRGRTGYLAFSLE